MAAQNDDDNEDQQDEQRPQQQPTATRIPDVQYSDGQKLAMAAIGLLAPIIGGAVAGKTGAEAGAGAAGKSLGEMMQKNDQFVQEQALAQQRFGLQNKLPFETRTVLDANGNPVYETFDKAHGVWVPSNATKAAYTPQAEKNFVKLGAPAAEAAQPAAAGGESDDGVATDQEQDAAPASAPARGARPADPIEGAIYDLEGMKPGAADRDPTPRPGESAAAAETRAKQAQQDYQTIAAQQVHLRTAAALKASDAANKPEKDDKLVQVQTTDDDGNPVVKFVKPAEGLEVSTTKGQPKPADQDKLYTETSSKIETARGNTSVQQARVNLVSATNALKLANKYAGNYDDMPQNDYALFVSEMSKIANGGAPSDHSQANVTATTLESKWDQLLSKTGGKPTGADLGEFIKNNVDYLKDLKDTSQDVDDSHTRNIWNGVRRRFDDQHQKDFMEDHADFFAREKQRSSGGKPQLAPTKSGYAPGSVVTIKGMPGQYRVGDDGDTLTPVGGQ